MSRSERGIDFFTVGALGIAYNFIFLGIYMVAGMDIVIMMWMSLVLAFFVDRLDKD